MNWLIYAGVFLFGAVALLIEARRNYDQSLQSTPFSRHPILANAKVRDLCTPRDGFIGYLIYSLLYIVSYIVILSSAELYDLIRSANLAKLEVGATQPFDPFGSDPLSLEGTAYAKPIFVSAFLIAIMSVGAMKPIENAVRSAAHRLAGIPRGVYQVIDLLQTPRFQALCRSGGIGVLEAHFRIIEREAIFDEADLALHKEDIKRSLRTIDAIWPAVSPSRRAEYFPAAELDKLNDLTEQLNVEMRNLRAALLSFDPNRENALRSLAEMTSTAANNTKALFSVHYIRNNRYVKNLKEGTVLKKVVDNIDRNYNPEQNSFAMAACGCFFFSVLVIAMIYFNWHSNYVAKYPFAAAQTQIDQLFDADPEADADICIAALTASRTANDAETSGVAATVTADETATSTGATPGDAGTGPDTAEDPVQTRCTEIIEAAKTEYMQDVRMNLIGEAVWDTVHAALIVFIAVGSVTFGRDVRLEQESWRTDWSFKQVPFLRLLGLCLLPSIFVGVVALGSQLAELWVDSNFRLTQSQIIYTIQSGKAYFAMMPLVGFIVAFGTLTILDKHNHLTAFWTLVIALFAVSLIGITWAAVIFFSYNYQTWSAYEGWRAAYFTFHTRDWLIQMILPSCFIVTFALLLEFTEDDQDDDEPDDLLEPGRVPIPLRRKPAEARDDKVAAE